MTTWVHLSAAALVAAAVTIAVGLLGGIRWLRRMKGEVINPDLPQRYRQKAGTPTMGGLLILAGFAAGALGLGGTHALGVAALTLAFGAIGFLDDWLSQRRGRSMGLKARQKLVLQFAAALVFSRWVMGTQHTLTIGWPGVWLVDLGGAYLAFAVLFIVLMSNATNLADGMDGLASGLTVLCGATLAVVASVSAGMSEVSKSAPLVSAALSGACGGFLVFNRAPARVFMGDTGSLALGACLAGVAVVTGTELVLMIGGAVFLVELLSVVIQVVSFKTTGRRVFRMSPLHHHFDQCGWPETKVVQAFWIAGGALSAVCLAAVSLSVG